MQWLFIVVAVLGSSFAALDIATSTNSYLSKSDREKLQKVVEPGLKLTDIPSTYYAVFGYKLLGQPIPNTSVS